MRSFAVSIVPAALALSLSLASLAQAAEGAVNGDDSRDNYVAAMRYLSLDLQSDNADARQYSGNASFTLGQHVWLQGSIGKLTDNNTDVTTNSLGDLSNFGIGGGFASKHVQLSLNVNQYKNDGSYRQRDVVAALDWLTSKFAIGLDVFYRNTDNSLDTVANFPTLGLTNVAMHIDETLRGNGVGLHADFDISKHLSLSLGGMSYNYDSDYVLTSSTNPVLIRRLLLKRPTISELIYLNSSGVTRSLALLDYTYNAGLRYRFSAADLSVTYYRDKVLDSDDVSNTVALGASIYLGDHFKLTPSVGQSTSTEADSIVFGSLSISYLW